MMETYCLSFPSKKVTFLRLVFFSLKTTGAKKTPNNDWFTTKKIAEMY